VWIVPVLVGFVVLMWLGFGWLSSLLKNYEHTPESAAVFGIVAVASLYAGWRAAGSVVPVWSAAARLFVALVAGAILFSLFSFMIVTLWMAFLTRRFDDAIAALEDEEEFILRSLESMRWQAWERAYERSQGSLGTEEVQVAEDPRDELRKTVEVWEQGGGAARIRSLKVLEWRDEALGKDFQDLKAEIAAVEREERLETDEAKREQLKARLAVYRLVLYEKEPPRVQAVRTEPEREIKADEPALRQRLQEIHRELQRLKFEKTQFTRSRVRLGWRS